MKKTILFGLLLLPLVPLSMAFWAAPEMPTKSVEELTKVATHVVLGEVGAVYTYTEKKSGFVITHAVAELTLEAQEKGDKLDKATPIYVRWKHLRDVSRTPRVGGSGHYGKTPKAGQRVRVYLARNAYDGWSADENKDGGFNVVVPNGFEMLKAKPKGKKVPAKESVKDSGEGVGEDHDEDDE